MAMYKSTDKHGLTDVMQLNVMFTGAGAGHSIGAIHFDSQHSVTGHAERIDDAAVVGRVWKLAALREL